MPAAARALSRLSHTDQERIRDRIDALSSEPRPHGVKSLQGQPYLRIRAGDFRVLYEVKDAHLLVLVVAIGHRREIYR